ncbi:iron ABC transporter permease [Candidatus Bathyarchaeota archaeon]|nr:iron ABC transporter permease [Candidatus Bathyarchaeota archaeon]
MRENWMERISIKDTVDKLRREFDPLTIMQTLISYVMLIGFLVLPLSSLVIQGFKYEGGFSLRWFINILTSPEYVSFQSRGGRMFEVRRDVMYIWGYDHGILLNSLIIAFTVTVFCSIIGIGVAMIMGRYEFKGKAIFKVILLIPLLATPFVNAYVVGKVFNPQFGLLNYLLFDLMHILPWRVSIDGLVGLIVIQTLTYYPIVYTNVLSSLNNIDPSLEEMAENLGSKGFRLFRTITLPLFLPGLVAGAIITFIFSLEDLGAPIGFIGATANPLSKNVASYQIYASFKEALTGDISPKVSALALLIMVITILSYALVKYYTSKRSYTMISKGGRWSPRLSKPKLGSELLIIGSLLLLFILGAMPQIGTFVLASTNWASSGTFPTKITGEYFKALTTNRDVVRAILNSLGYSIVAVVIMIIVGSSISYVVAKRDIPTKGFLDLLATVPVSVPGVSLAVSYFLFFSSKFFRGSLLDLLTDPALLLILAYSIRRLPFTTRSVYAGLQQIDKSLEEASLNLGATRTSTFTWIVIPLIVSNVISGALLSFVYSMSEVSTSVTLGALSEARVPITFFISQIVYGTAAVGSVSIGASLCILLMAVQITAMAVSNYVLKQKVSFLGV